MRPQPSSYVQKALETLHMSQTELGDALKKRNPYQTVHGWITGRKKLEYDDVLGIAELCGWITYPSAEGQLDNSTFGRTLIGQIVRLLDLEPALLQRHPDLLRAGAAELRGLASRMEAAAEGLNDATPPS